MARAGDVQLLTLAMVIGAVAGWTAARISPRGQVGAVAVLGALLLALLSDRWIVQAVPRDLLVGLWPWVGGAAVAAAVGRGASRLPVAPTAGLPPVLPLTLASLLGVWAGVPETSVALLAIGVLVGLGAALVLSSDEVTPWSAVVIAVAPVVASVAGATGEWHAVAGGLLCTATLVVVGAGRVVQSVSATVMAGATALQLAGALVAARHVGIVRDWGDTALPVAVVVVLAIAAAAVLHRGQCSPA